MDINLEHPIVSKLVDRYPAILHLDYWHYQDEPRPFASIDDEFASIASNSPEKLKPFVDSDAKAALILALELSGYRGVTLPQLPEQSEPEPEQAYWYVSDCQQYLKRVVGDSETILTVEEWKSDPKIDLPVEILVALDPFSTPAP